MSPRTIKHITAKKVEQGYLAVSDKDNKDHFH